MRDNDRESYEHSRRDEHPSEYQRTSSSYIEESRPRNERDRDWHEESTSKEMYERSTDRHQSSRDWDHKHRSDNIRTSDSYSERKDWATSLESNQKWENRKNSSWQEESGSNWNSRYKDDNWQDSQPSSAHHNRSLDKSTDHGNSSSSTTKPLGGVNRRWNSWRGRGRGSHHHSDFRRTHHHTEILEERGEIYRRHINPGASGA